MDYNNIQPNSYKSREARKQEETTEKREVKKVVKGNVKTRKNEGRKLMNTFISEDAANVKSYVIMDVLVPAVKKAISDIVRDGIDMILYGESKGRRSDRRDDRPSYRSYYNDRRDDRREDRSRSRSRFDYDDLVLDTRGEAELLRDNILDDMDRYGLVTVADLYDMAGLKAPYTAEKYGWMGLRYIEVKRVKDGYILQLPKAMPID